MVLNLEGGPLKLSGQRIPASTDISVVPAWDSADIKDATKYVTSVVDGNGIVELKSASSYGANS